MYLFSRKCSAKCGEGMQRRAVTCHRVNIYGWIDPTPTEGCPMDQRPVNEQICKLRECRDEYYWTAGPWKKVSAFFEILFRNQHRSILSSSFYCQFVFCIFLLFFFFASIV